MPHLQPLEPRQLLAAVTWQIAFSYANVTPLDPATQTSLRNIITDAGNEWAALIPDDRKTSAPVVLTVDVAITTNTTGQDASLSGSSSHETKVGTAINGVDIYDQAATARVRYGDAGPDDGPDIRLQINPAYLANTLWLDPDPAARTAAVPEDRIDAYSAILHEFGHVFFFNGFRDYNTYQLIPDPGDGTSEQSAFDALFVTTAGNPFFAGGAAMAAYNGQPIPLTSGNPYHFGEPSGSGSDLRSDLMNGIIFDKGIRYALSNLDRGLAADLVTTATRPAVVDPPPDTPLTQTFTGSYTYNSANGIAVTTTIANGGGGRLIFPSTAAANQDPTVFEILGGTKKTIVTIGSNQPVNVPNVTVASPIATFDSHLVTLTGSITLAGAATLKLGAISNATLTIGTAAACKTATFGAINASTLSVATPATVTTGSISTSTVTFSGGKSPTLAFGALSDSALTLPANKKLTLPSATNAAITTGALTALSDAGTYSGTLHVTGNIAKATFGSLSATTVTATGNITSLAATSIANSRLTAAKLTTLLVTTTINGSTISVPTITTLTAKSGIDATTITASAGLTTLTTGPLTNSAITVGLTTPITAYPTTPLAFATPKAAIKKLTATSFSNTVVVAPTLATVTLGTVAISNNATPFGLYARALTTLTTSDPATSLKKKKLPFSTTSGDFSVTLA